MNSPAAPSVPPQPLAPAVPPPPPGKFQQWLIRTFQPGLAGNIIFGVALGGVVALIVGVLASILLVELFLAIAPNFPAATGDSFHFSGQDIMEYVIGLTPLHSSFRDGLQLFFLMHGFTEHIAYTSGSSTYNYTYNPVLSGLLIVPALALALGGYIAASTDLQNRARVSLVRGVAIAIPYAILMLILAPQVNGSVPLPPYSQASDIQTISVDPTSLFIFSLLWGLIFGMLGATLKLGRGRWRHMAAQYLASLPQRQIVGMLLGGLCAVGLGIALSLLVIFGILAFSSYSVPIFLQNLSFFSQGYANWQYMTGWAIVWGPLHAVNLFAYSFGAPVTISAPRDAVACFYQNCTNSNPNAHLALSLFNGSPHLPSWTNAFVVLPIISLFLGGRVSAAFGRAQTIGQGALQGAIIAVPFTVLVMLLSAFSMLSYQYSGPFGQSNTIETLTLTFGVNPFDLLLWALMSGAVLGGLGGAYQLSTLKAPAGGLLRGLATPLKALGAPGLALVDRLSRRPRSAPHTAAQRLIAGAVFAAILLLIASGAVAVCFITFNQSISYLTNTRLRDIGSVIAITLPGLLLVSAGAAALAEESLPPVSLAQTAPLPPPAPPPAPMPPYPTGQSHQQYDYRGGN